MKEFLTRTVLLAAVVTMSGCAFTVHDVKVDHTYSKPPEVEQRAFEGLVIDVEEIVDRRTNTNEPAMIFHITNLNGQRTTGGWQAERPIGEIIRNSLIDALSQAGARIDEPGDIKLSGELIELDYEVRAGFWSGTLTAMMQVKLQMMTGDAKRFLWHDNFHVSRTYEKVKPELAFRDLLDQFLDSLLQDGYFGQVLNEASRPQTPQQAVSGR